MKAVLWVDSDGRRRRSLIKDTDGTEMSRHGIPADPPDIRSLDWEAISREIEALQFDFGLFTWRAALNNQVGLQACINVFKRHLLELYRKQ